VAGRRPLTNISITSTFNNNTVVVAVACKPSRVEFRLELTGQKMLEELAIDYAEYLKVDNENEVKERYYFTFSIRR
jgi:hypothetical protein